MTLLWKRRVEVDQGAEVVAVVDQGVVVVKELLLFGWIV